MCILCSFVQNWEKRYDRVKYPLRFYSYYLKQIEASQNYNDLFTCLFRMLHWKLGKVRKGAGEAANTIIIDDMPFTWSSIDRNFEKYKNDIDFLKNCFKFRNGVIDGYNFFRYIKEKQTFPGTRLVLYIFLMHLLRPKQYPMIDQHVWRAMNVFQANLKSIYEKPKTWSDYKRYMQFFNDVVESLKEQGHPPFDRQTIDRALMAFGKWIMTVSENYS